MSEEALQIATEREAKGKSEREGYFYLNAEFQRIARREKKDFLSEQCKEIEKNNKMGKARENLRYQGNISYKDGHNIGQKLYGPHRSRRYSEEMARIHRKTIQNRSSRPR